LSSDSSPSPNLDEAAVLPSQNQKGVIDGKFLLDVQGYHWLGPPRLFPARQGRR